MGKPKKVIISEDKDNTWKIDLENWELSATGFICTTPELLVFRVFKLISKLLSQPVEKLDK